MYTYASLNRAAATATTVICTGRYSGHYSGHYGRYRTHSQEQQNIALGMQAHLGQSSFNLPSAQRHFMNPWRRTEQNRTEQNSRHAHRADEDRIPRATASEEQHTCSVKHT